MDPLELTRVPGINPQVPEASRIYDYTLGGTHNFAADRQAAEYMYSLMPSVRKWVRMLRTCLRTAARRASMEGFGHWVDFGSGLPTEEHVHTVLTDARVLYSDINPLTIATAKHLLGDIPNVRYLQCDLREAESFLQRPEVTEFLQGERRVVFGANGITVFLSPEENRRFFRALYDWAAPGSKVFVTFETKDPNLSTPQLEQFVGMFQRMGELFHLGTLDEYLEYCLPWTPDSEGVKTVREFLALPPGHITEADREGLGLEVYAVMLEKR